MIVAGRRKEALAGDDRRPRTACTPSPSTSRTRKQSVAFAKRVIGEHPELNVLINNAGIMRYEDLTRARDLRDAEETVVTNLLGPIRLTNALIDHLAVQPDAAIVNVSSGLAFVPLSGAPTYSATKAAIHSYTVSLREQLRGRVEVIELVPPAVQTELTPGQATRQGYMPLRRVHRRGDGRSFSSNRRPREILVERVGFLRWAERDGRFDRGCEDAQHSLSGVLGTSVPDNGSEVLALRDRAKASW